MVHTARGGVLLAAGATCAGVAYGGALLHLARRPVSQPGRYGEAGKAPAAAADVRAGGSSVVREEERTGLLDALPQ